ncbi:DedA family protein [Streptomyces sp. NPDC057702]|uniref:DedA family protein n=1 Tax=unclassified Streptomyces TaxID=2593676 RepID=UPI003699B8D1
MIDWMELAASLATSPWLYLVLVVVSLLDSFLPLVPSEPVVIAAGVSAAAGDTAFLPCVAATALGAFLGDLIPYALGRLTADRLRARLAAGTRRRRTHDWIARELASRGGYTLMASRFVPVGRYLVTLSAGVVGYPPRRYALFTGLAATCWSAYTVLIGYVGGALFRDSALTALGVGLGLACALSGVVEGARHLRRRRAPRPAEELAHEPAAPAARRGPGEAAGGPTRSRPTDHGSAPSGAAGTAR